MRVVLKPLFDAELPAGFEEILKNKLERRELRTGEEIEIDLLGKPLRFRVLLAEPSPLKVGKRTRVDISRKDVEVLDMEFDEPVVDVLSFEGGFVFVLERKVLILNHNGQKIYSDKFDNPKLVRVSGNSVVILHGENKVRLVKP